MGYFEMSKLALKWALTKPPTTRYPFEPRQPIAGSRGQIVSRRTTCVYCTVCAKKCPTGALVVNRAEKNGSLTGCVASTAATVRKSVPRNRWRWWKAMAARR